MPHAGFVAVESRSHHLRVTDALEGEVGAAAGHLHQVAAELLDLARIDELRRAELARDRFLFRIGVDADDVLRAGEPRALHDIESDAAKTEHDDSAAALDLRCKKDSAQASGRTAADVADRIERRVIADLRDRIDRQYRVLRERSESPQLGDGFAAEREATFARPQARERFDTQVRLRRVAVRALSAMWNEERNDVIADLELRDPRAALDDDARRFMAENRGKLPRHLAFVGVQVGVAQAGRFHLHQHFAGAWTFELALLRRQKADSGRARRPRGHSTARGIPLENGVSEGEGTLHHRLQALQAGDADYSLHAA